MSGQWGAIASGAFTGLAVAVVMATLGAALGMTASAASADQTSTSLVTDGAQAAAVGFSIGAGIWLLLSAVVVGFTGGRVLARTSNPERSYAPGVHGFITWAVGLTIAVLIASPGTGGLAAGLGAGAAGAAASAPNAMRAMNAGSPTSADTRSNEARERGNVGQSSEASIGRNLPPLTPEERAAAIDAAETAATAAATAAWFAVIAQLIGLGATLWAAGRRKFQAETGHATVQHA